MTPGTALILPLAEIAALCHDRGVLVLADGAHVPGNIAVDIDSFGVDWYVANLHKWAWAPRSAGLLWSAKEHQSYLHPTVISWGLDHGIAAEFDLLGHPRSIPLPRRAVRDRADERVRRRRGCGGASIATTTSWRGGPASTSPTGGARASPRPRR